MRGLACLNGDGMSARDRPIVGRSLSEGSFLGVPTRTAMVFVLAGHEVYTGGLRSTILTCNRCRPPCSALSLQG